MTPSSISGSYGPPVLEATASRGSSAGAVELRNIEHVIQDGTRRQGILYLPSGGGKYPTLIERTPYGSASHDRVAGTGEYFAARGYAVFSENVRGRHESEGGFYPFAEDSLTGHHDGSGTIDWVIDQPWCNGDVATFGGSYSGLLQYFTGRLGPLNLLCQFVRQGPSSLYQDWAYEGGAFRLAFCLHWTLKHMKAPDVHVESVSEAVQETIEAIRGSNGALEDYSLDRLESVAEECDWYRDWRSRPTFSDYWDQWELSGARWKKYRTPVYHLTGWFDLFLRGSLAAYEGIRDFAKAQPSQMLVIGPWDHGLPSVSNSICGEVDFGPDASVDMLALELSWFDYWMKGRGRDPQTELPVRLFVMGQNEWRAFDDWPPPTQVPTPWYLGSDCGGAPQTVGHGSLAQRAPTSDDDDTDEFMHLSWPVLTVGGRTLGIRSGPYNQRTVERQGLAFTSRPLEHGLLIAGPVTATLYVTSTARSMDWIVRLSDVAPDGFSRPLCDGIVRVTTEDNVSSGEADQVAPCHVNLIGTANMFLPGHRIRLSVTNSSFPRWDLNPAADTYDGSDVSATNTVGHGPGRPSHVLLPVIGDDSVARYPLRGL